MVGTRGERGGAVRRMVDELLERLIDPAVTTRGGDQLRRMRTAVMVMLIILALLPVSLVTHALAGRVPNLVVSATMVLGALVLLVMIRRGASATFAAHAMGVVLLAPVVGGTLMGSGPL